MDGVGGLEETLALIQELKLTIKADKGVYGHLKREMWRESVKLLETEGEETTKELNVGLAQKQASKERELRVKKWELEKAKL